MKKQEYFDMGIAQGLSLSQIESVLCNILQVSQTKLFTLSEVSSKYIYEIQKVFFDISHGVSTEYAINKADFYGREFFVDNRVLIPRNDTEILVKQALIKLNTTLDISNTVYIDVWTGSWCIVISIINEMFPLKFSCVYAFDVSSEALEVAEKNKSSLALTDLTLKKSSLLESAFHDTNVSNKHLFLTANLPYIKSGDFEHMDASVVLNEPDWAFYWW